MLLVIAAGGALGAVARWVLALALPHGAGEIPWSTVLTNVSGSLLLGVLMVIVTEVVPDQRLLRPFLGVGVLGGYTTFSTAALDVVHLAEEGRTAAVVIYLGVSLAGALAATWLALAATRAVVRGRRGTTA